MKLFVIAATIASVLAQKSQNTSLNGARNTKNVMAAAGADPAAAQNKALDCFNKDCAGNRKNFACIAKCYGVPKPKMKVKRLLRKCYKHCDKQNLSDVDKKKCVETCIDIIFKSPLAKKANARAKSDGTRAYSGSMNSLTKFAAASFVAALFTGVM
ncbi:hypothetical protein AX774_g3452 [Zancudomyces culisetae]|uniref:Uncharacterized protein n=1 Tax=Zancudomyces culisetae TaxID=1213189 RepID=A0A1R1PQ40_ZANCU|nr:hypothetical protein AX774_g3452 [Zancudomyces culisetae]|eukprot:OMH83051.1 hypothetical protein AX774_g3452 [Zancudomyces culisetae]